MTHHVLILSGNLPGLLTAYRLVHYGFRITILEHRQPEPATLSSVTPAECPVSNTGPSFLSGDAYPLILHAFDDSTWSLFQEIALDSVQAHNVDLEFTTSAGDTVPLIQARWLSALHPILRLGVFKGLSWSDRWHLMNYLEKQWEGLFPPDPHSDTRPVESWLLSAGQSTLAMKEIWNPLCRFFLKCEASQASLEVFLEVLSRFRRLKPNAPMIQVAPPDFLQTLQTELTRILQIKGVDFCLSPDIARIHADSNGIRMISLSDGERLTADVYVSTLPPRELLRLLPERAPARFSCFSHLDHLREYSGTAVRFLLKHARMPPRVVLNTGLFDWVVSQPVPDAQGQQTLITGIHLQDGSSSVNPDERLNEAVWVHMRDRLGIASEQAPSLPGWQSVYTYLPCLTGLRTFRPIAGTPISNLFLSGPWTATPLPPSLESAVISANSCASALAEVHQTLLH